ncbi:MAG: V-type ATP synthase subunit A, partial [Limnochordia bacterium]
LYVDQLEEWTNANISRDWTKLRADSLRILQEEAELEEIVRLVGIDSLSPLERVTLEAAKSIREDYLHQNAFHDVDTYTSLSKQYRMLQLILAWYYKACDAVRAGVSLDKLFALPVRERIGRAKYVPEDQVDSVFGEIEAELNAQMDALTAKEVDADVEGV